MKDRVNAEKLRFRQLLAELRFADRYYSYCDSHRTMGPDIPLATQTSVVGETGRAFRYHKGEKFFAWRAASPPDGCDLGLNLKIDGQQVEWILVFKTPTGHLGTTFASLASTVKQLAVPGYRHDPPYAVPSAANKAELATILEEGLALFDEVAAAIAKQTWS